MLKPAFEAEYRRRGWQMFPAIDRVYVNERARRELGWRPCHDFESALARLAADEDPRSPLAPSAQYWLGNAQFALHDFRAAITSQRQLIASYPDSSKVPDALLNIASSQLELGDGPAARRTLEDIVARYPQSDAAGKARQRLAAAEPAPRRAPAR